METAASGHAGKIRRTQLLNYLMKRGSASANTLGVIALMYSGLGWTIYYLRDSHKDHLNTLAADHQECGAEVERKSSEKTSLTSSHKASSLKKSEAGVIQVCCSHDPTLLAMAYYGGYSQVWEGAASNTAGNGSLWRLQPGVGSGFLQHCWQRLIMAATARCGKGLPPTLLATAHYGGYSQVWEGAASYKVWEFEVGELGINQTQPPHWSSLTWRHPVIGPHSSQPLY